MVDTFFLKLENNLADKEDDNMFNNEDELIEYSEKVAINYENLFCSDYLKSEMRKYIVECADVFDSKFATDYDKIYIDNWFDFINCDDFEKVENEDDDQEDNISLFSETEEETENAIDIEIEEVEEAEMCVHCDELIIECECIYCTNCDEKMAVCHCIADFKQKINELGAENANHIRQKEVLCERIKFLEAMKKQDDEIMDKMTKRCNTHKLTEQTNNYLMNELIETREKVKEMEQLQKELDESQHNHSVDARALFKEIRISCDLRKEIDSLKIDLEEMKKDRDDNENNFFEVLKKKDILEIKEAEAQDALKNHKLVISRLREEAKELKNEVDNIQELFNKAIEQRNELQNGIKCKSQEINKLEHERDDLKAKYNQMYNDRQHFCKLNSERWDELQKTKKQLDKMTEEKKERIDELNNIIWNLKNERDEQKQNEQKQKERLKQIEQSYIDRIKQLKDAREDYITIQKKLDEVKKILIE